MAIKDYVLRKTQDLLFFFSISLKNKTPNKPTRTTKEPKTKTFAGGIPDLPGEERRAHKQERNAPRCLLILVSPTLSRQLTPSRLFLRSALAERVLKA